MLNKGDILQSESEKYQLKLQPNGILEIICEDSVIWSPLNDSNTDSVTRLYFKNESRLGVYLEDESLVWAPEIGLSNKYFHKLVLENDGRLILYDNKVKTLGSQTQLTNVKKVNFLLLRRNN